MFTEKSTKITYINGAPKTSVVCLPHRRHYLFNFDFLKCNDFLVGKLSSYIYIIVKTRIRLTKLQFSFMSCELYYGVLSFRCIREIVFALHYFILHAR